MTKEKLNKRLRKEYAGFRKGRSYINQIFIIRNIIEQCNGWERAMYLIFVYFTVTLDWGMRKVEEERERNEMENDGAVGISQFCR